ncbi:MAG TPA: methyl-accepting chemotaxis protein [Geopsychrobacteraceae bacterium]|nr:methyl-accepting chemotaxis protein [Geopsychrobacteraceae bacterium]
MNIFRTLYIFLEKKLFCTLNRKISGNIFFLTLFLLLPVYYFRMQKLRIEAVLASTGNAEQISTEISEILATSDLYLWGMTAVIVIVALFTFLFLRYLVVVPTRQMINFFDQNNSEDVNLEARLPTTTYDEYLELSEKYNQFIDRLRRMISTVRKMGVNIAVNATRASRAINDTAENSYQQRTMAKDIFNSSGQATQSIDQVANHSQTVSESTGKHLDAARKFMSELSAGAQEVEMAYTALQDFQQTVSELNANSAAIQKVVELIQNMSSQTNMLALNAAIEAARVGQHGRGFAVVAQEVRTLATRSKTATDDVSESINTVNNLVRDTYRMTEGILENISDTRKVVREASNRFQQIVDDFDRNSDQLMKIASTTEQLSATNTEIHSQIGSIDQVSEAVSSQMQAANDATADLSRTTEEMQDMVSRFVTGHGNFERVLNRLRAYRDEAQAQLQSMMDRGINVLDQNYRPISGTDPQKYTTSFDEECDRIFQEMFDNNRATLDGSIYCLITDVNGYVPTHHTDVSQPLTGDYEYDMAHSRQKRLYADNDVELRRATNRKPFLLQTYIRDTGAVLSDISLPIYINGQFWGAHIVGFDPEVLVQD